MKSMKLSLIFFSAILVSLISMAQTPPASLGDSAGNLPIKDSITRVADSVQIAQQTQPTIVGLPVSQPVQSLFIAVVTALATILGAIQYLLKRIPTVESAKITGVIGKALDVVTFFQPDKNTTGGNHDKPDPGSAAKKA